MNDSDRILQQVKQRQNSEQAQAQQLRRWREQREREAEQQRHEAARRRREQEQRAEEARRDETAAAGGRLGVATLAAVSPTVAVVGGLTGTQPSPTAPEVKS